MSIPRVIEGTYVAGRRSLEYWTQCEHCPQRKNCDHTCDHPGFVRFLIGGQRKFYCSGIITVRIIQKMVRDLLECDESDLPADIYVQPRGENEQDEIQWEQPRFDCCERQP